MGQFSNNRAVQTPSCYLIPSHTEWKFSKFQIISNLFLREPYISGA